MLPSSQRDTSSVSCPHRGITEQNATQSWLMESQQATWLRRKYLLSPRDNRMRLPTQPSCLGFFTSNCSLPLLAGWPRNVSYIATSVSGSPTRFLPTVLSRNADFTKSLPKTASVEHDRGPLGKVASGLKKFQEEVQKQMLLLYLNKAYCG